MFNEYLETTMFRQVKFKVVLCSRPSSQTINQSPFKRKEYLTQSVLNKWVKYKAYSKHAQHGKKICFLCFSSDKNLNYLPFVN